MTSLFRLLLPAAALLAIAASGVSQLAHAEQVYKTTGKNGVVVYSNVSPDTGRNSEIVQIAPEPALADIQAAQQQLNRIEEDAHQRRLERVEVNRINNVKAEEKKAPKAKPLLTPNLLIGLAPFL